MGVRLDNKGKIRVVVSTFVVINYSIGWIKRFCYSRLSLVLVVGVDITYKLGFFYFKIVIFFNLMFVYKNNESKYFIILEVVMILVSKEIRDYEYFVRLLKSEGIELLTYRTDGECALERDFESVYFIEGFV